MSEIIPISNSVSRSQMRRATDSAHLHIEHCADEFRMVSTKIACIGYFVAPRHRPEFLRVLRYIQTELPMNEEAIRCISICLDVLRERFSA
jgi:hypothetical protein